MQQSAIIALPQVQQSPTKARVQLLGSKYFRATSYCYQLTGSGPNARPKLIFTGTSNVAASLTVLETPNGLSLNYI